MPNRRPTSLDRRIFLGAGSAAVLGVPGITLAQQQPDAAVKTSQNRAGKTAAEMLAEFIVGFDLKAVPPEVIARARTAFVDTVGVMLAGSQLPPAAIVGEVIKLEGSAPTATIVGRPLRAAPQLAALANGVAGHDMDFDFTYFAGQSIAGVIPAILPVAETTGATQAEMLAAFIVAAEVAGRISRAANPAWRTVGWHTTGTIGVIAAAAASARLMKIDAEKILDVIGITTSLAGGLSVNFGSMTKPLHAGHAARDGVLAALLGAHGYTANAKALEGKDGYFDCFSRDLPWSLEAFDDLGQKYDLVEYGYKLKPYPCGGLGHPAIDAALEMRGDINPGDVAHVEIALTTYALRRITSRYPTTAESAKFSGPYLAAYTLVHGAPLLAAFTEEALRDEAVRAAAQKVSLVTYQEYADVLDESPAKVTVTLNDGRKLEGTKYYSSGSVEVPMSAAQLKAKFDVCAAQAVDQTAAARIYAILSTLGDEPSLAEFWPLLHKA
jgi:2-methylcitrate dehydratase PrpD